MLASITFTTLSAFITMALGGTWYDGASLYRQYRIHFHKLLLDILQLPNKLLDILQLFLQLSLYILQLSPEYCCHFLYKCSKEFKVSIFKLVLQVFTPNLKGCLVFLKLVCSCKLFFFMLLLFLFLWVFSNVGWLFYHIFNFGF